MKCQSGPTRHFNGGLILANKNCILNELTVLVQENYENVCEYIKEMRKLRIQVHQILEKVDSGPGKFASSCVALVVREGKISTQLYERAVHLFPKSVELIEMEAGKLTCTLYLSAALFEICQSDEVYIFVLKYI